MPHVIFELSDNVIENEFAEVLTKIHQILTNSLPAQLESCKSRVIRHKEFLVGNGDKDNAFIHLAIEVLSGRSNETLNLTANRIITILPNYFKESAAKLNLNISVAISNLPDIYHKI